MYLLMKNMYLSNENDIIFINIIKLHLATFNLIYYLIGLMKDLSAEKSLSDMSLFVLFEWKPTRGFHKYTTLAIMPILASEALLRENKKSSNKNVTP